MANYQYEAMNPQGKNVSGTVSASDEAAAAARLSETGLLVLSFKEIKEKTSNKPLSKKKVKAGDLALFSRQLGAMVGAGIPITQSVSTLSRQTDNAGLAEALADIATSVESGLGLAHSFGQHPKIFSKLYVSMISAGEDGGILDKVLTRLAVSLQKDKQLNDNIKSATAYPKMIGGFAVVMFFAMLLGMVPMFEGFTPATVEVPALTAFIYALSHNIRDFWYFWILGLGGLIFGIVAFTKSSMGRAIWENSKLKLPLIGQIIHKTVIARFSRTFATMLQGGIPVIQALQSAGPTAGSDLIQKAVEEAIVDIESGKSVGGALDKSGLFPPMVINMVAIGEEAGTLPDLLDRVAEFYEEDVAMLTKSLGTLIEPIMLLLVGMLVGGMLLSLYLPIFTAVTAQ